MENDRRVMELKHLKSQWNRVLRESKEQWDVLTRLNALQISVEKGLVAQQEDRAYALGGVLWHIALAETEGVSDAEFHNVVFDTRIFLATYWPKNHRDREGFLMDPYDHTRLDPESGDLVALSSGYLMKKETLIKSYTAGRHGNFDRMPHQSLNAREIKYLKDKGIKTLIPDPVADYGIIPRAAVRGWFARTGRILGDIVLFMFLIIVDLPPLVMLSLSVIAIIGGIVGSRRRGIEGFFTGYFFAYLGSYMATLVLTVATVPLIGLLTYYSIIPVSAVLWAEGAWNFIQPCIPVALLVTGAIGELMSRFSMSTCFVAALTFSVNAVRWPFQFVGARIDNIIDFLCRVSRYFSSGPAESVVVSESLLFEPENELVLETTPQMLQVLNAGQGPKVFSMQNQDPDLNLSPADAEYKPDLPYKVTPLPEPVAACDEQTVSALSLGNN